MAKFGSTNGKKFGSDAGRQRIQERRDRLAEVRSAPKQQVPAENVQTETEPAEGKGAAKSGKRR